MNELTCPLCLQENNCDVTAKQGCWCNKVQIPEALLDLVDAQAKNKHCICNVCISRYIDNPNDFCKKPLPNKADLSYPVTD
ncbi:cysteine-rich CWC family protein [Psychromonas sp. 14N.309.X.WAT.B.A12]|uniref:cysteine-rich CWC family protein n=1 Tax=unclassified Psychromonas TaxID=2614957 RepID=UPI0025B13516|nr:cysteine-rich CWC family protein [Psychromonas sp. 14N.309.X.WAT.B.A12]MDN2661788.1 cysteine-rich CWC family protein [Psychromonas sp. 14N.309.X.WAT.B.A12]